MVLTDKRYKRVFLLAMGGILTGLMLIFPKAGLAEWLTLIPVGIFLLTLAPERSMSLRALYGWGLFFFYCYYLVTFHWFIYLYPMDFIDGMTKGSALVVVLAAWLGLSLLQALMGGLVFVAIGVVFRTRFFSRFVFLRPMAAAGIWAIYEWTQTLGWWGVPWGRLPLGQSYYLVGLQTASWFGSYFVTFLLVAVNLYLAQAIGCLAQRKEKKQCVFLRGSCVAAVVMLVFQYGCGTVLYIKKGNSSSEADTVKVAAVQGNISSHEKWDVGTTQRTKEVYRAYTLRAAEEGAQIVVWPETALPYVITDGNAMARYVSDLAKESGVTILVGCFTQGEEGQYNSIVCFLPDGTMHKTVYAKRRLVPFGEFVPMKTLFETLIPPLADLVMSGDDVAQGEGAQVLVLEEGTIGSLICFDSIYEELTRESVLEGADLICLSTNDSWFTDSAALYMHNAQAQLRAIESGRWVVRAANTGISTVISDRGEVLASLPPLEEGILVEEVRMAEHTTLYTYIGNLFVYLWILVLTVLVGYEAVCCGYKKRQEKIAKNIDKKKEI